jgi:hypothetical protein
MPMRPNQGCGLEERKNGGSGAAVFEAQPSSADAPRFEYRRAFPQGPQTGAHGHGVRSAAKPRGLRKWKDLVKPFNKPKGERINN